MNHIASVEKAETVLGLCDPGRSGALQVGVSPGNGSRGSGSPRGLRVLDALLILLAMLALFLPSSRLKAAPPAWVRRM